jgi:hypothetical protein
VAFFGRLFRQLEVWYAAGVETTEILTRDLVVNTFALASVSPISSWRSAVSTTCSPRVKARIRSNRRLRVFSCAGAAAGVVASLPSRRKLEANRSIAVTQWSPHETRPASGTAQAARLRAGREPRGTTADSRSIQGSDGSAPITASWEEWGLPTTENPPRPRKGCARQSNTGFSSTLTSRWARAELRAATTLHSPSSVEAS